MSLSTTEICGVSMLNMDLESEQTSGNMGFNNEHSENEVIYPLIILP